MKRTKMPAKGEARRRAQQNYQKKGVMVQVTSDLRDILNQWKERGFNSRREFCEFIATNIHKLNYIEKITEIRTERFI